jgi:hypothetical protein
MWKRSGRRAKRRRRGGGRPTPRAINGRRRVTYRKEPALTARTKKATVTTSWMLFRYGAQPRPSRHRRRRHRRLRNLRRNPTRLWQLGRTAPEKQTHCQWHERLPMTALHAIRPYWVSALAEPPGIRKAGHILNEYFVGSGLAVVLGPLEVGAAGAAGPMPAPADFEPAATGALELWSSGPACRTPAMPQATTSTDITRCMIVPP